jgi:hypothetical protein
MENRTEIIEDRKDFVCYNSKNKKVNLDVKKIVYLEQ